MRVNFFQEIGPLEIFPPPGQVRREVLSTVTGNSWLPATGQRTTLGLAPWEIDSKLILVIGRLSFVLFGWVIPIPRLLVGVMPNMLPHLYSQVWGQEFFCPFHSTDLAFSVSGRLEHLWQGAESCCLDRTHLVVHSTWRVICIVT
jgi:hypothetical protein